MIDRFSTVKVLNIRKMIKICLQLFQKAEELSNKVLKKYLFQSDINEFKNQKILPKLFECQKLYDLLSIKPEQNKIPEAEKTPKRKNLRIQSSFHN